MSKIKRNATKSGRDVRATIVTEITNLCGVSSRETRPSEGSRPDNARETSYRDRVESIVDNLLIESSLFLITLFMA